MERRSCLGSSTPLGSWLQATALDCSPADTHAVMFSSTTDPYQVIRNPDMAKTRELTNANLAMVARALELIRDQSNLNVRILTRSPLARVHFDLFRSFGPRLLFGMSIPTLRNNLADIYEPKAPAPTQRLETLQKAKEQGLHVYVAMAGLIPPLVAIVVSYGVLRIRSQTVTHLWLESGLVVIAFIGTLIPMLRWGSRSLIRYHNDRLGYLGERFVGDCLEPLKRNGWYIFHDVPGLAGERKFNLDHVAVGPGGVWAIETKTRRKGRARRGFDPHKVFFDGTNLVWPWGEDPYGPEQAKFNSEWLQAWLLKRTGIRLGVCPVLALPGW
jgi:hypothetical protein